MSILFTNQDACDLLAGTVSNSVDLVLIDPPYTISRETNFARGNSKRPDLSFEFGAWDVGFVKMPLVVAECYRVLRKGGTFISFYDLWKVTELRDMLISSQFKQLRFIEWLKSNPVPVNCKTNYLSNAREVAISAVKVGKPTFNSHYDNALYTFPVCRDVPRFHVTQKPLDLIRALVSKHSNAGDTVLDCFAGSGTTLIACQESGRSFVGCELDERYYRLAAERGGLCAELSVLSSL